MIFPALQLLGIPLHSVTGIAICTIVLLFGQELVHAFVACRALPAFGALPKLKQSLWLNTSSSLVHASICACLVLRALADPASRALFRNDVLGATTAESKDTIAFSLGYFVFDSISMQAKGLFAKDPSLIAHHVVVVLIEAIAASTNQFHALVLAMLLAEINSTFLHARALMRFDPPRFLGKTDAWLSSPIYAINNMMLVCSFIVTRLCAHAWVFLAIYGVRHSMHPVMFAIAMSATCVVNYLNVKLGFALMRSELKARPSEKIRN
eukprot:g1543.t1